MKRIFLLAVVGLSSIACSVESDELDFNANEFQELNAAVEVAGCTAETYEFGEAGIIEVINNDENLYVSIVANEGYSLVNTRLHIAADFEDFPTVGNGDNLPPGQMAFHEPNPDSDKHTFVLDLEDYPKTILIASNSIFSKGGNSESLWAGGTAVGKKGKWSYFQYEIKDCKPTSCEGLAGEDNYEGNYLSVEDIYGWGVEDLEEYIFSTLLDEGVPRGGDFDPTLESIVDRFTIGAEAGGVPDGKFEGTYTITTEDGCTDSVKIGATVQCEAGCAQ